MQNFNYGESFNVIGVSVLLSFFSLAFAYSRGFFHIKAQKWESFVALRDLFGAFLFFVGVQLFIAPLTAMIGMRFFLGKIIMEPRIQGWFVVYSMTFACLALFFYTSKLSEMNTYKAVWPEDHTKKISAYFLGMITLLVAYPLVIAVGLSIRLIMAGFFSIQPSDQVAVSILKFSIDYPVMSMFMIFGVVCLVPVAEEVLFRGYLQGWLRGYLKPLSAIMTTSTVFAGFHFSANQGWSNIELLISLFLLSLFLGILYEKTRTLWAPIGLHTAFNALNTLLLLLNVG